MRWHCFLRRAGSLYAQMQQLRRRRNPVYFRLNEGCDVRTDLAEVGVEFLGGDGAHDGQGLEGGLFGGEGGEVVVEAAAEGFELNELVGSVGDHADEFPRGEGGD